MATGAPDAMSGPGPTERPLRLRWLVPFLVAMGFAHTAPLSLQPHLRSIDTNPDMQELVWRLAWGAHALTTDPGSWLDANTFYPDEGTYATMDYLLGVSALAVPIRALTENPLLVYNATTLLCLALTALGVFALATRLTGGRAGGAVAATVLAFSPLVVKRFGQINILAIQWLPFLLLAAHALRDRPEGRGGAVRTLGLTAALFLAVSSGGYQAVFAAGVLGWGAVVLALRPGGGVGPRARFVLGTGVAIALAGALFAPLALPYLEGASEGRQRSLRDVEHQSPAPGALLHLNSTAHGAVRTALRSTTDPDAIPSLFPGFVVWALALAGVVTLARTPGRRHLGILYGALVVAGFGLSIGTHLPGYRLLFEWLPPLRMIRAPSRFTLVGLLGLSVLAAFGTEALRARLGTRPRLALALAPVLCLAHLAETWEPRGGIHYRFHPPPEVYRWLADQEGDFGILELPTEWDLNPFYLVYSTYHWKPIVNGYHGSFISAFHSELLLRRMIRFPEPDTVRTVKDILGLRYLVLHPDPAEHHFKRRNRWHARQRLVKALEDLPEGLELVHESGGHAVLEIVPPESGWITRRIHRLASGKDLRERALEIEVQTHSTSRGVRMENRFLSVRVSGEELARVPLRPERVVHRVELPAESIPKGIHDLDLVSVYRAEPPFPEEVAQAHRVGDGPVLLAHVRVEGGVPGRHKAAILLNGEQLAIREPGYAVVVVDPFDLTVLESRRFGTTHSPAQATAMAAFLDALPEGRVVLVASTDLAGTHLDDDAVAALRRIGSDVDPRQGIVSHALIGAVGAAPGSVPEQATTGERARIGHGRPESHPDVRLWRLGLADRDEG